MKRRRTIPRWLVITVAAYLGGVVLWFDFFFWVAATLAAFTAGLIAFAAVVGLVMHLVAPDIWSTEDRTREWAFAPQTDPWVIRTRNDPPRP